MTVQRFTKVVYLAGDTTPYVYGANGSFVPLSALTDTSSFRSKTIVLSDININAYQVAANLIRNDNVATVAGDIVLILEQSDPEENGPYVVGTVVGGFAELTRPVWWASGSTIFSGTTIVNGGQGSIYKNTTWQVMRNADSIVVDTTDPEMFPQSFTNRAALVGGNFSIATAVRSTSTGVAISRTGVYAGGGDNTAQYVAKTLTPGSPVNGSILIEAQLLNGAINAGDTSTLIVTVTNQR